MASERITATAMMNRGMAISTLSAGMVTVFQMVTGPACLPNSRSMAGSRNFSSRAVSPPDTPASSMEVKKAGLCRDRYSRQMRASRGRSGSRASAWGTGTVIGLRSNG